MAPTVLPALRTTVFRLHFLQRFLAGPRDLVWRGVASCIFRGVSHLGLDTALFLTDFKFLKLNGVPSFYQSVFKVWAFFKSSRVLSWLLKEPLIHGARLDISSGATPGLTAALLRTMTLDLQHLVHTAGLAVTDSQAVGHVLSLQSSRMVQKLLRLYKGKLTQRERRLLMEFGEGAEPDPTDPFPEIQLRPQCGPVGRAPCIPTEKLGEAAPHWRVIYKPPLKKRTGDLQWRVLHGAIASNSFTSIINPAVSNPCPFCYLPTYYGVYV